MAREAVYYILVTLVALLTTVAVSCVHVLNWTTLGKQYGIFHHSRAEAWMHARLCVMNIRWTMHLWVVAYVYQLVWLLYTLTLVCQRTELGPLYKKPSLVPWTVLVQVSIANIGTLVWLFLWDRERYPTAAILPLVLTVMCYYGCLTTLTRNDTPALRTLASVNATWLQRVAHVFVYNGIAYAATWTFLVATYHVCMLVAAVADTTSAIASFLFYPIFLVQLFTVFSFEVCLSQYKLRMYYAHYVINTCAPLGAVLLLREKPVFVSPGLAELHTILLGASIGLSVTCLLLKLSVCYGKRHHPAPHHRTTTRTPDHHYTYPQHHLHHHYLHHQYDQTPKSTMYPESTFCTEPLSVHKI